MMSIGLNSWFIHILRYFGFHISQFTIVGWEARSMDHHSTRNLFFFFWFIIISYESRACNSLWKEPKKKKKKILKKKKLVTQLVDTFPTKSSKLQSLNSLTSNYPWIQNKKKKTINYNLYSFYCLTILSYIYSLPLSLSLYIYIYIYEMSLSYIIFTLQIPKRYKYVEIKLW